MRARALFLVTRKFYCIVSAHESAATARKCYYIHFEIAQIQDLVDSNIYFIDAVLSWFLNKKQNWKRFYIKIRNRAAHDLKLYARAIFDYWKVLQCSASAHESAATARKFEV